MSRRRIFVSAAITFALIIFVYVFSGARLALVARDIRSQADEISTMLADNKSDRTQLGSLLRKLSANVNQAESGIDRSIWKPIIWASGKSDRFEEIRTKVAEASSLLSVSPGILGVDAPRKYLIAFLNPAEARGPGGIIGGYAKVEVSSARIKILKVGSNTDLKKYEPLPFKMPREFMKLFGHDPGVWQDSNLSPHFPDGASIWLGLWKEQFKEVLDGVITVDPIALGAILKVIGPVTMPDGQVITYENVVEETLSKLYQRFEKDNVARKSYLATLAKIVLENITTKQYSKTELAKAMLDPLEQGRILFYSSNPEEEAEIAKSFIGGVLDDTPNNEYRAMVINMSANKMDYYLDRKVVIESDSCSPIRRTTIAVTLTNTVDPNAKLPSYVVGRPDLNRPEGVGNSHGISLGIYGPTDSQLVFATNPQGDQSKLSNWVQRKRSLLIAKIDLKPGIPQTIKAQFIGGIGPIAFSEQPLVRPVDVSIFDICGKK